MVSLDYNKADFAKINDYLSNINWSEEMKEKDANDMWIKFHSLLYSIVMDHPPLSVFLKKVTLSCSWGNFVPQCFCI